MERKYKTSEELKNKFQPELVAIYDIKNVDALLADVKENGILGSATLAIDGSVLDGHKLIKVADILGLDVPYIETDLEPTVANRIALNNHRQKTWMDVRNEYLCLFETFGKKQGVKKESDMVKYDRYDEISNRIGKRYTDPQTIRDVEVILKNDNVGFPMSWWLLEKNCEVKPVKDLMELSKKEDHKEIYEKVQNLEMSPKVALKEIELQKMMIEKKTKGFKIPKTSKDQPIIYKGDPEEVMVNLSKESIMAIFFDADRCSLPPEIFGTKVATRVKPFTDDRLSKYGSLYIRSKETYLKGFAQRVPEHIIKAVEKETKMIYKQTLFQTGEDSFTDKRSNECLPDEVTQLLWFVKSENATFNNPFLIKEKSIEETDESKSLEYKICSNHLNNQSLTDMIFTNNNKDEIGKTLSDSSALIPIYMSTKENDLVVDLTMKADVASAAVLMNRRFIGITSSSSGFDKGSNALANAVKEFSEKPESKVESKPMGKKKQSEKVVD